MKPLRTNSAYFPAKRKESSPISRKISVQQLNDKNSFKSSFEETFEQQLKKNNIIESLGFQEKQLMALKGAQCQQKEVENMFKSLNKYAMKILEEHGLNDVCIIILQWIIQHRGYQDRPNQICLAYNNLGCVYRRMGQTQLAINAFENALSLIQQYDEIKMKTITHLNITAVLSQMNLHEKALKEAKRAIQSGYQEFDSNSKETIRCLSLAHYNYAFELESLDRQNEAVKQYKRSLQFVTEHLGNQDPLYKKFYNGYQQAKQKLIVHMNEQSPILFKKVLSLKKQFDVPTDESFQQITPQQSPLSQTRKLTQRKRINFIENETVKKDYSNPILRRKTDQERLDTDRDKVKDIKTKLIELNVINSKPKLKTQVEQIQIETWSNSEHSDEEIKLQRLTESSPYYKGSFLTKNNSKEQRLSFLNKQNSQNRIYFDTSLIEKEKQIIREVEEQIYNTNQIAKIQAQIRMKKERKKFYNLKKVMKDKGTLLQSDELKLKKLQRFLKKKIMEQKLREMTKNLIQYNKTKKNVKLEKKSILIIVASILRYKARRQLQLYKYMIQAKQFQTIRQSFCNPLIQGNIYSEETYVFTFSIMNDNSFIRFALTHGMKEKRKENSFSLEVDLDSFLKSLGLLYQYADELQSLIIEESKLLRNIQNLMTITKQFLYLNEMDGKYIVRTKTETNKQFRVQLEKIGAVLQELVLIENNKIIIQGINNFDYTDVIPKQEYIRVIKPPLYNKLLTKFEEQAIKCIQSYIRGHLQRLRMQKWINNKTKQIYDSYLIKTYRNQYLQIVKTINVHSKKRYISIINHESQKKSNDLEIQQIVFKRMGDICSENIFEIFKVDLESPYIEYSNDAQYWIQREEEYSKRGAKVIEKIRNAEKYVVQIQRAILRYLFIRRCQIRRMFKKMILNNSTMAIERKMLVRRVMIYGQGAGDAACLTAFYLDVEKTESKQSLNVQSEYQSVIITSKNLEHAYSIDKIIPYRQRLFQPLEIGEIISIAYKMIEASSICKNKKGLYQVHSKSVEQIGSELVSQLNRDQQDESNFRENTLQVRQMISSSLTQRYLQQSVFFNVEFPEIQFNQQQEDYKQNNFIISLQQLFRIHNYRRGLKVKQNKYVDRDDETSIRTYVYNTLPCTEYGTNPNLYNDQIYNRSSLSEFESLNLLLLEKEFIEERILELKGIQIKLIIEFCNNKQSFIVQAENLQTQKIEKFLISIEELSMNQQIPYKYLKENVSKILSPFFDMIDDQIIFKIDEIIMQNRMDEYLSYQECQNKNKEILEIIPDQILEGSQSKFSETVTIGNYYKGTSKVIFEFERQTLILRIIIQYQDVQLNQVIEIDSNDFRSKYINESLNTLSNLKVINFFKGFSQTLTKALIINETQITHNFEDLRPHVSLLLKEKFVQKIQGILLVKRMVEKLKIYKQLKRSKLFLQKFILNNGSNYIEIDYFLIKHNYNLQLTMREITFTTHQGRVIEKGKFQQCKRRFREKQFVINLIKLQSESDNLYQSLHKKQDQIDFQRINFAQLSSYDKMKSIEYYRQLINPLIQLIQKNIQINYSKFLFQFDIPINVSEKNVIKQRKFRSQTQSKYHMMIICILSAQAAFRRKLFKDWIHLKVIRKRQLQEKNKYFSAEFVMRTFKLIQEDSNYNYYIVNVYKQDGKVEDQIQLTFELISINKKERMNKLRASCLYDNSQLIHFGQQNLFEFFINKIRIEEKIIKFDENKFLTLISDQIIDQSKSINQNNEKEIVNIQKIVPEDLQEVLIDQERTEDAIVNIVYTNSKETIKKNQDEESQENVTKLQIDLQEVKKLYPSFNFKDPSTMKTLSSSLIKGVKVDQKTGNLLIDKSRIQSSFINPINLSKNMPESCSNIPEFFKKVKLAQRPHSNNVLAKTTFYSQGKKHLIVISYVRRKINKILQQDRDSVFDDHQRIFEIKASNLNFREQTQPLFWYLTPDDAEILTHQKTIENVAKILIKQIQIINNKFVYLCFDQKDQQQVNKKQEDNVVFFVESSIKPMQEKFRNRILRKNHKEYKKTLNSAKKEGNLILQQVGNFNAQERIFIQLFIEEKEAYISLKIYDVGDQMQQYETEISIKKYLNIYLQDKVKFLEVLLNFIEFKTEINKILFLHPKPDLIEDYLKKQRQFSMQSSSESIKRQVGYNLQLITAKQDNVKMLKQIDRFQSIKLTQQ